MLVTTKGTVRPLSTGGGGGGARAMLPQKNLKLRSSEMQFPTSWALKRVLFMIIFIDQ